MFFYSNPRVLYDEMGANSVLITEHRYTKEYDQSATSGKYCVQFVTFKIGGEMLALTGVSIEWKMENLVIRNI